MKIDELTIGEAKELACLFGNMSIMKDLFIEEYERIESEAEEAGKKLSDEELGRLADAASRDRFADMCDEAKDRAK